MAPPITPQFITDQMPEFVKWLIQWANYLPIISSLMAAMIIDIMVGICRAISKKNLSSTLSWAGMCKKVVMMLFVGLGAVLQPFAGGLPLANGVAMAFLVTEGLSILENGAACGVWMPRILVDSLIKLRNAEFGDQGKPSSSQTTIHVEGTGNVKVDTVDTTKKS